MTGRAFPSVTGRALSVRDVDPVALAGLDAHGQRHRVGGLDGGFPLDFSALSNPFELRVTLQLRNAFAHPLFGGTPGGGWRALWSDLPSKLT